MLNNPDDNEPNKPQKIDLDSFIGKDKIRSIEFKNKDTNYDVSPKEWRDWLIKFSETTVASIIGMIIVVLLVIGIVDDRVDVEKDIEIIQNSKNLTEQEQIEYRIQLRDKISERHTDVILPLLTLILGYYFGNKGKETS